MPTASDLREPDLARVREAVRKNFAAHGILGVIGDIADLIAAIRAEAKAEGWEDAIKFLQSWPNSTGRVWGDVLAANRPKDL